MHLSVVDAEVHSMGLLRGFKASTTFHFQHLHLSPVAVLLISESRNWFVLRKRTGRC